MLCSEVADGACALRRIACCICPRADAHCKLSRDTALNISTVFSLDASVQGATIVIRNAYLKEDTHPLLDWVGSICKWMCPGRPRIADRKNLGKSGPSIITSNDRGQSEEHHLRSNQRKHNRTPFAETRTNVRARQPLAWLARQGITLSSISASLYFR